MTTLLTVQKNLHTLQQDIAKHTLIQRLGEQDTLRQFMSQHVFIVWDFVNLIKALHGRLTRNQIPWWPAQDPEAVRLLYEILIEEETDEDPRNLGQHISHLSLYLQAMQACGADTQPFEYHLQQLKQGHTLEKSLDHPGVLEATRRFVSNTLAVCQSADLPTLAAYFVFGREAMVPKLFTPWLQQLKSHSRPETQPLEYYLSRHIELDSDAHFPKAARMLSMICQEDNAAWDKAEQAAKASLQARLDFLESMALNLANLAVA